MHLQPVFRQAAVRGGGVAAALFETGLCLPSGSSLTAEDQQRVIVDRVHRKLAHGRRGGVCRA